MKARSVLLAAALLGLSAAGAAAQSRISLHGRVLAAVPTGDFSLETGRGLGFGGEVRFRVAGPVHAYLGYSSTSFGIDQIEGVPIEDDRVDLLERGYELGVLARFQPSPTIAPFVKAGALAHFLRYSGEGVEQAGVDGEVDEDIGVEVGGGVDIRLSSRLDITPSITYRYMGFQNIVGGDSKLSLIVPSLGLTFRL